MKNDVAIKIVELFQSLGTTQAYALIFLILLGCGLGVPIPEDVTLISAGIISAYKTISIEGALIAGFIGVLAGDTILFSLGKKYGRRVYTWPLFRRLFTADRIAMAEIRINRNARFICFIARFMPGLRAPIYLTSGTMGVKFRTFIFWDSMAALVSVPIWVFLGHWFASNIDLIFATARKINIFLVVAVATVLCAYIILKKIRRQSTP